MKTGSKEDIEQKAFKVVITGGPYSGKTTIIQEIKKKGFFVIPEAAIEVINDLNKKHGVEGQVKWRMQHMKEFQFMVTQRQAQQEASADKQGSLLFLDRGRHDSIAYFRYYEIPVPDELLQLIEQARYDRVFILDTLSAFEQRPESGRTSDRQKSIRTRDLLDEVYREYGHEPIQVPEFTIRERVDIILASVREDNENLRISPVFENKDKLYHTNYKP